ncbi:tRNA-2-methylthio-N(6)-dimethylallyladenosine synthase [uncultured archaeon]|nr:tRNA-2-methylthio-N(6)-dimethylallyladenosine synthase [uncultured archaeon]
MRAFVEGYGCSMAGAETESAKGFLAENGFELSSLEEADVIVINTCAVKQRTENHMLRRIKELAKIAGKNRAKLVVFGCLTKVSAGRISEISGGIIQAGPGIEELASAMGIEIAGSSLLSCRVPANLFISIVPIASGCTSSCSFCGTKLARGKIKSRPVDEIVSRIEADLCKNSRAREFWLTGQDTGAYGIDIGSSLPELLRRVLSIEGDFRLRIGMMNPQHLKRIFRGMVPLFNDPRLYRFLHVPVQSGSGRILKLMKRGYSPGEYLDLISRLRSGVQGITIATDIIVGFPGETDEDFNETIGIIGATQPDVVNISRFGPRPGTEAAKMGGRVDGGKVKKRTRALTMLCRKISLERNSEVVGWEGMVFFSEKGRKGGILGRTQNYKQIVVNDAPLGSFAKAKVVAAKGTFLEGRLAGD